MAGKKVAVDDREAKAPVKAAVMYKQNIARKVGEWLREIRFLLNKEVWGPVREARVEALLLSLNKAPWTAWCSLVGAPVPEDPRYDSAPQRSQYWVEWADAHWDTIHLEVIRQARHALSKWKLSVRDSLSSSDLTTVSRWIKAHNTLPVLRTERGEFVSHPHLVGQKLTETWQDFFGRDTAALNSDEVEAMAQGIEPYHAEVPILDSGELKAHVMKTANSRPRRGCLSTGLIAGHAPESLGTIDQNVHCDRKWRSMADSAAIRFGLCDSARRFG